MIVTHSSKELQPLRTPLKVNLGVLAVVRALAAALPPLVRTRSVVSISESPLEDMAARRRGMRGLLLVSGGAVGLLWSAVAQKEGCFSSLWVKRKLLKLVGGRRIVVAHNILKYSRAHAGVKTAMRAAISKHEVNEPMTPVEKCEI